MNSKSTPWMNRVTSYGTTYPGDHTLKFFPWTVGFYDNPVTNSTQTQTMNFYYAQNSNGYQGASFTIPSERMMLMEGGRLTDATSASDRHMFTINSSSSSNCAESEIYNLYFDFQSNALTAGTTTPVSWTTDTVWTMPQNYQVFFQNCPGSWGVLNYTAANNYPSFRIDPTGSNTGTLLTATLMNINSNGWGSSNGCQMGSTPASLSCPSPNPPGGCNSASGQKFFPSSYQQLGGTDAAGMPISALSAKGQEWVAALLSGRTDLGHAIRTTLTNLALSSNNIWPATLYALPRGNMSVTAATPNSPTQLTISTNNNGCGSGGNQPCTLASTNYTPCSNYTYVPPCTFGVLIRGIPSMSSWAGLNGFWPATAVDDTDFTVPFNATGLSNFPGAYFDFDFMPYGATIRLMHSFDVSSLCMSTGQDACAAAQIILNTIQRYGLILADGTGPGDNWDSGVVESEYHDDRLTDAGTALAGCTGSQEYTCPPGWTNFGAIDQYLEVVDRSMQIGPEGGNPSNLGWWQQTTARTYVTVTGSLGSASQDVIPLGTTIGTDRERLTLPASSTYQLNVWVNGNMNTSVTYATTGSGIASVSSGLVTMSACSSVQEGGVTVTSTSDSSALPLYIDVWCIPVSSDHGIRMAFGNWSGNYMDSRGFTWWGATNPNAGFNNWYQVVGNWFGTQEGSWQGNPGCSGDTWSGTDYMLYARSMSSGYDGNDLPLEIDGLANGTYTVTLYGEPGYGGSAANYGPSQCGNIAGQNVFTYELQGTVPAEDGYLDGFVLAGDQPYMGWQLLNPVTVSDGKLTVVMRNRNQASTYGAAAGSLLITPGFNAAPGIHTACSGEQCKGPKPAQHP